ncbi:MAG: hypothetical protein JNL70_19855 [Saprospiraceae bacterium]|nr:hypothetical protein [Saprospiraceae bacterium]
MSENKIDTEGVCYFVQESKTHTVGFVQSCFQTIHTATFDSTTRFQTKKRMTQELERHYPKLLKTKR